MTRFVPFLLVSVVSCAEPRASAPAPVVPAAAPAPARDAEDELEARIREVVVARRAELRACYEAALERDAGLAGKVVLVVEVDQSGRAAHVFEARREGGFGEAEVKCFAGVLRATKYHDGAARPVRIQVPLAFAPATSP